MSDNAKESTCDKCSGCTCSHAPSDSRSKAADSRSKGLAAYAKLRREVAAARLRVSIAKRRGRKISPRLLALSKLNLPPTLDFK